MRLPPPAGAGPAVVMLAGMGGSAIGADLLRPTPRPDVPVSRS